MHQLHRGEQVTLQRFYSRDVGRARCYHASTTHAVADSQNWQSRLWTWCDLCLDWGDRASEPGKMTKDTAWSTEEPVSCFLCLARMP